MAAVDRSAMLQVITALMVIYNEPLCVEWRHQALQGLQFPDHPNHVAQIWVALTPLLQPNLSETLAGVDGTDLSQDMHDRLKAAQQIMQGVSSGLRVCHMFLFVSSISVSVTCSPPHLP